MNTYRYTFIAACPGNGEQIVYSLELRHTQKVLVEHIKTACALHKQGHQEDIAADLHARFGGLLTLRAAHHGVEIETVLAAPAQAQEDARVYTYKNQPCDNVTAWRFGEACVNAKPGGDLIDRGLSLLQQLEAKGYGIVAIDAARAAQGGA